MADPGKKKGFLDRIMSEADESAHPLLHKIQEHQNTIILVIVTVLVLAAVYSGYTFFQERTKQQALDEMNRILAIDDTEDRVSALETFLDTAPKAMQGGALLELTRIYMDKGRYEKAADAFNRLGEKDKALRPVAVLGQAKALELMNESGRSLEVLEKAEEEIPREFRNQYYTKLAYVAEQAGNYSRALEAYERLKQETHATDPGFIRYKMDSLRQMIEEKGS